MLIYANFTNVEEKFTTLLSWTNGLRFCFCFYDTLVVKSAWRGKLHFFNVFFLFFLFFFGWRSKLSVREIAVLWVLWLTAARGLQTLTFWCVLCRILSFLMGVAPQTLVLWLHGAANSDLEMIWHCKLWLTVIWVAPQTFLTDVLSVWSKTIVIFLKYLAQQTVRLLVCVASQTVT